MTTKIPGLHDPRFLPVGTSEFTFLPYRPRTIDNLKENISATFRDITPQILEYVRRSVLLCKKQDGHEFKHRLS
jgi:hypothetical protein